MLKQYNQIAGELENAIQLKDWPYVFHVVNIDGVDNPQLLTVVIACMSLSWEGQAGHWDVHIDNLLSNIYNTVGAFVADISNNELTLLVHKLADIAIQGRIE